MKASESDSKLDEQDATNSAADAPESVGSNEVSPEAGSIEQGSAELEAVTVQSELLAADADRKIEKAVKAVKGRRGLARGYLRMLRRRNPNASPAEIVAILERHYITAISAAGVAVTVGTVAAEVGMAFIPFVGPAAAGSKAAAKEAGKKVTKEVIKSAAKTVAIGAAKTGMQKAVAMIPAGDQQLQFEITALFALSLADLHEIEYDQQQAHALVYGLSNGRVSQQQIAAMAADLAKSNSDLANIGHSIADGRKDWSHWANTLADSLPGGSAQSLVRGVQTGVLEDLRVGLNGKQQAAVEYGVGALVGGITRFVFGREVVVAARSAFAEVPASFPDYLAVPVKAIKDKTSSAFELAKLRQNRAFVALEDAAKNIGSGVQSGAGAVGSGVKVGAKVVANLVTKAAGKVASAAGTAAGAVAGVAGVAAGAVGTAAQSAAKAASSALKKSKKTNSKEQPANPESTELP